MSRRSHFMGGCSCGDTADIFRAQLAGKAAPKCMVHDVERQRLNTELEEARLRHEALRLVIDEANAKDQPPPAPATSGSAFLDKLAGKLGVDPASFAPAAAAFNAPAPNDTVPLNAPTSSFAALDGMNTATDNRTPFDGPDAA